MKDGDITILENGYVINERKIFKVTLPATEEYIYAENKQEALEKFWQAQEVELLDEVYPLIKEIYVNE